MNKRISLGIILLSHLTMIQAYDACSTYIPLNYSKGQLSKMTTAQINQELAILTKKKRLMQERGRTRCFTGEGQACYNGCLVQINKSITGLRKELRLRTAQKYTMGKKAQTLKKK